MTDKAKSNIGTAIQVIQFVVSVAMLLFLAGAWRANTEATQVATATQVAALTRQIEALKAEVTRYADENRNLHAALAEQFVTRREWLLLLNHAGKPELR